MAANRVFSGYCRIEAMAGGGQALLLEGLRVHLDLQLEPEATAPMPAGSLDGRRPDVAATERAAPRGPRQATQSTPAYQQWAVLAALATLLLALASWWVGGEPEQLVTEPTDTAPSLAADLPGHAADPAAPTGLAPAAPATAALAEPGAVVPVLAPPAAPGPVPSARRAAVASSTPRPPSAAPGVRARAPKTSASDPAASVSTQRTSAALQRNPPAPEQAPQLGNADLLYLFGDTK